MKIVLIFKDSSTKIITAKEVLENKELYKGVEFVDPEEEFNVNFTSDCKGHNGPYFRLYLSRENYNKLTSNRKSKYDYLVNQRHYQESLWHRYWEEKFKNKNFLSL